MSIALGLIVLLWVLAYGAFLGGLYQGWRKVYGPPLPPTPVPWPSLTIVIVARNEAAHIPRLLASLAAQDYPGPWNIYWFDDASTDASQQILEQSPQRAQLGERFQLYPVPEGVGSPKKRSITWAAHNSSSEWILTTDGDGYMGPSWAQTMLRYGSASQVAALGPVTFFGDSLFVQWQQLELAAYQVSGAVTSARQRPTLSNGANFLWKRALFHQVGGYADNQHIASGDDEFLLHKLGELLSKGQIIRFAARPQAQVFTQPNNSLAQLLQQRLRWASKWNHYRQSAPKRLAVQVYAYHFTWCLLMLWAGISGSGLGLAGLILPRLLGEWALLGRYSRDMSAPFSVGALLIHQFTYSPYVVALGFLGLLGKGYGWKGRQYP